ncbi:MAG TPA: Holliday junction branch migration protein RuvA [Bacteroidota bacterium]|nr:Holliday junction branch migration protein RuvA [Bacteroidota bacterium]
MIASLRGKKLSLSPHELVLDVNGVGYLLHISQTTFTALEAAGPDLALFTYLHVREDALQLYGFAAEAERELFSRLIGISGIGPKIALAILSGLRPADLREAILAGNIGLLTSIPGVGRKTAERIVLELRPALGKIGFDAPAEPATSAQMKIRSEAIVALMSLGFTRTVAEKALLAVISGSRGADLSVEDLVKLALRHTAQQ